MEELKKQVASAGVLKAADRKCFLAAGYLMFCLRARNAYINAGGEGGHTTCIHYGHLIYVKDGRG